MTNKTKNSAVTVRFRGRNVGRGPASKDALAAGDGPEADPDGERNRRGYGVSGDSIDASRAKPSRISSRAVGAPKRKEKSMKETVKMSRAVGQLEKMYNTMNADFFGGALPVPIITVQSKPGTWGHCSRAQIWKRKGETAYEMNIAAEAVGQELEEIMDTLLHEMVHLYCRENGIQEVSRGGTYHNKKFKELAEGVGLVCVDAGKYGGNTQGHGNDKLTEYALALFVGVVVSAGLWVFIEF